MKSRNRQYCCNTVSYTHLDVYKRQIVDEPTAAAAVLKISDGAVVDVGGGTTGISILKDGKVIYTDDEATGGSHMTMIVAGHYNIPYEEAEILKTDRSKEAEIFPVIKATVEKMATITQKFLTGYQVPAVYVVGGSASFEDFTLSLIHI